MVWSGLGIAASQPDGTLTEFNNLPTATKNAIMANFLPFITQFPRIRIVSQREFGSSATANHTWALAVKAYNSGIYIHYGIANSSSVYLPTFYDTFLPLMLAEAQWAQDNLMDEFQVGNEFEINGQSGTTTIQSLTRSSNVVTVVTVSPHNLQTGDDVSVGNTVTPSDMGAFNATCTVIDANTLTYVANGADGSGSGANLKAGERTIIRFVKLLAAQAQAVFTRGPITYSVSQGHEQYWTSITPGTDLDTIGLDIYGDTGYDNFVSLVNAMFAVFGTQMIVSEFNLHSSWSSARSRGMGPTLRGFDIAYGDELARRRDFLRTKGIQQAYFFCAWNASAGASNNNNFTIFYNTNPTTASRLLGNWKSGYDRLLEKRVSKVFLGTQQGT